MKKKNKKAAKILYSWRKAMPFYYAIALTIVVIIIFNKVY